MMTIRPAHRFKSIFSYRLVGLHLLVLIFSSAGAQQLNTPVPKIGFLDFVQDATVEQAHLGFMQALRDSGFSESDSTLEVSYINAQGDIPTLGQACDLLISQNPDLLATNLTLPTITAVKKTSRIPVFMMVSPRPDLAGLTDSSGKAPANLSGVYETLDYIGVSVTDIKKMIPRIKSIGTIYNQSEPQSRDAFDMLEKQCKALGIQLQVLPVSSSADAQLVTEALLQKKPDVFFALPDNVIFAAFETIVTACNRSGVPVFTSESGLVNRGAVASYGADFYQWGYQSGVLAAHYLKEGKTFIPPPEMVKIRKHLVNKKAAAKFGIGTDMRVASSDVKSTHSFYLTALLLGLAFVPMALGIYITLRIFNIPDITTDGSYTLGAAVTAILLLSGWNTIAVLPLVIFAGMCAGMATGFIHTRLKVHPLLAGILVMTALYSVNLIVMGRSNIPLPGSSGISDDGNAGNLITMLGFAVATGVLITWLLRTDFGLSMRATGNSERMVRANGVNTDRMKVIGLAIANALTAVSGYLVTRFQLYADINMGIGIVISGLAAVMLGESLLSVFKSSKTWIVIGCVIIGSLLFRFILAWVLTLGLDPNYLKLVTAFVVLFVVAFRQ
ncbi:MAG TPA: ABC transporter substrate binding protein [Bacteroidia bacterium]|nr:ABC transporter substrate binding protein [Bacteroidia bacterium]